RALACVYEYRPGLLFGHGLELLEDVGPVGLTRGHHLQRRLRVELLAAVVPRDVVEDVLDQAKLVADVLYRPSKRRAHPHEAAVVFRRELDLVQPGRRGQFLVVGLYLSELEVRRLGAREDLSGLRHEQGVRRARVAPEPYSGEGRL